VAAALAVALVAGSIGAGAGAALAHRNNKSTALPAATTSPFTPPTFNTPPTFTTPGGSGGSGSTGSGSTGSGSTGSGSTPSSGSSSSGSLNAAAIAAKVNPAVVDINTVLGYQQASAAGTGMVITSNGEVLTNNHVVQGATSIKVTIPSTGKTYSANVLGTAPSQDVALLQLQGASGLKTVSLGDASKVSTGDPVLAIGNALGKGGTPAVTQGTVSAVNQAITAGDPAAGTSERLTGLIQTDAQLQPGDSGGPLVNSSAQVIGMDTAASSGMQFDTSSTAGFAIPINTAMSIAHQIEQGKASSTVLIGQTGFLGVQVRDATSASTGQTAGAQIVGVASNSPADAAGLTAGDVITTFDNKPVTSSSGLTSLVNTHHPGDRVQVGWVDQSGQSHTAIVHLTTGPVK
jgi:S1-C subfamily serine protease